MNSKNSRPVIPASVIKFVLNYKPKAAARDGVQTEQRATANVEATRLSRSQAHNSTMRGVSQ
ncbi:MAG TPA: hypothetical protein G4N96_11145 [Chloroflexi bacterium]|nr:MAG: hypothetical protein B6243_06320 [Anaerolineaceae bacterium 4572_5.2]HEY85651.1 hypothetical protein [Chloroflexota bacterium]